jgi:hypothetical protein
LAVATEALTQIVHLHGSDRNVKEMVTIANAALTRIEVAKESDIQALADKLMTVYEDGRYTGGFDVWRALAKVAFDQLAGAAK